MTSKTWYKPCIQAVMFKATIYLVTYEYYESAVRENDDYKNNEWVGGQITMSFGCVSTRK